MGWTKGKKRAKKKVAKKRVAKKRVAKKRAIKKGILTDVNPPIKKVNWIKQAISRREKLIQGILEILKGDYQGYQELIMDTLVEELLFYHYNQNQLQDLLGILEEVEAANK